MALQCRVLEVSRSGYYGWLASGESDRTRSNRRLLVAIRASYRASGDTYGSPRVYRDLRAQGERCGRHRVARLMREHGIRAKQHRCYKVTTDSRHDWPLAANVLERRSEIGQPNRVWVSDLTYIPTREGWMYLAVVLDLFSRRVVGWGMSSRLNRRLAIDALEMALWRRRPVAGLLHHSDRGCQYASNEYRQLLAQYGMQCSMSRKGDCWDNAVVESFFHTLKTELVHHRRYRTRQQARVDLFDYIELFYNRRRRHSHLNYVSPVEYETKFAA